MVGVEPDDLRSAVVIWLRFNHGGYGFSRGKPQILPVLSGLVDFTPDLADVHSNARSVFEWFWSSLVTLLHELLSTRKTRPTIGVIPVEHFERSQIRDHDTPVGECRGVAPGHGCRDGDGEWGDNTNRESHR